MKFEKVPSRQRAVADHNFPTFVFIRSLLARDLFFFYAANPTRCNPVLRIPPYYITSTTEVPFEIFGLILDKSFFLAQELHYFAGSVFLAFDIAYSTTSCYLYVVW